MDINKEVTRYQNGCNDYTADQKVIIEAYIQMLFDISSKNILAVTAHMEAALNACK